MKANFSSLFNTPVNKYKFFFIYGNDTTVFDRIIFFLNKKFSSSLEITSEKELLASSSTQLSLFEKDKDKNICLVFNVSDKILTHIDQLGDEIFIFTSEKARAQSKLVTYFTNSSVSLAIAAYSSPITTSEFEFLVGDLDIAVSFKGQLFKAFQNDYMGLLATLEKIKLYGDVSEADYASFLESHTAEDELKLLIHSFLLKNVKKVSEILLSVNPVEIIPLLRTLTRSFQTLYELMPFKKTPSNIAWLKLQSPVFFKDQPIYQTALSRWSLEEVKCLLETLLHLEYKIKYESFTLPQVSQKLMGHFKL